MAQALGQEWVLASGPVQVWEQALVLVSALAWEPAWAQALGLEQASAPALVQEWVPVSALAWEPAWALVSGPAQVSAPGSAREWGPVLAQA